MFTYRIDLRGEPSLADVSATFGEALGFDREEVLEAAGTFEFLHPDDLERFRAFLADPPDGGVKELFRIRTAEGETVRGRHIFRPVRDADGETIGLECVVYERPPDWELPYDAMVEAINEGILVVRFDGEILYANERMASMIGYTPQEMVGAELFEFMTEEWADRARENLERRKRGVEEVFDHQFLRRDGDPIWTLVATKPMPEARGFRGSLVAIRNISRRKQTEKELEKARDELEERVAARTEQLRRTNEALQQEVRERREAEEQARAASRAKSAFLANMSHELRTPLNAVIGYTDLVRQDLEEVADGEGLVADRAIEDLEKVRESADHLLELINDILDLTKVEAGKMDLEIETFDVGALLEAVVKTTRPVIEENGNTISVQHHEPDQFTTDRTKLRQILINLVGNAGKFTEQGSIVLRAEECSGQGEGGLRLEVEDDGIGMEPSQIEELFEPFTQADQSSTRRYEGTGLGLTIGRRFAEMLGGALTAESEPGVGTAFTLVVPPRGEGELSGDDE